MQLDESEKFHTINFVCLQLDALKLGKKRIGIQARRRRLFQSQESQPLMLTPGKNISIEIRLRLLQKIPRLINY